MENQEKTTIFAVIARRSSLRRLTLTSLYPHNSTSNAL